jgi:hypothetical protein
MARRFRGFSAGTSVNSGRTVKMNVDAEGAPPLEIEMPYEELRDTINISLT